MALNILKRRFSEAEVNNQSYVNGEWKIEIVCPNGEIKRPLGDKYRKNLIQDTGLNSFNGTYPAFFRGNNLTSINDIIYSAYFGDSSADPFATNKTFLTSSITNSYWTRRINLGLPENTSPYNYDFATGTCTFTKAWDFQALDASQTRNVREIIISATLRPVNSPDIDQMSGQQYTFENNPQVISRFILPETITLNEFQFLRLYYSIKISVPALVNPIPITVSNNGFDGTGLLKLVGLWSSVFAAGGHFYQHRAYGGYNYTSKPQTPWSLIGRGGISLIPLKGDANPSLNWDFPTVNTDFTINYGDAFIDYTRKSTELTSGGSLSPASNVYSTIVGQSISREATLLLQGGSPSAADPMAGFVMLGANDMCEGSNIYNNPGDSPSLGFTALSRYMWYWKFTDATFSSPRSVIKDPNYGLVVNLRQTMTRG